ncbi:hypothetical protein E2C01_086617 [Portunus trituberculatus]|uniref:Uncharacterized protein n=1 Tax=Portunus trituberculatus TaxID=210409 RepID=A0A5B7J5W2_PORTR|nr:hypothetical protein [Portunus trituberculatus]
MNTSTPCRPRTTRRVLFPLHHLPTADQQLTHSSRRGQTRRGRGGSGQRRGRRRDSPPASLGARALGTFCLAPAAGGRPRPRGSCAQGRQGLRQGGRRRPAGSGPRGSGAVQCARRGAGRAVPPYGLTSISLTHYILRHRTIQIKRTSFQQYSECL